MLKLIKSIFKEKHGGHHRCPRRGEFETFHGIQPGATKELPDVWRIMPNGDLTCSYCGSLHPDNFFNKVVAAKEHDSTIDIAPSDKGYKFYVHEAGVKNASEGGIKFYTPHVPGATYVNRINKHFPDAIEQSWRRHNRRMDLHFFSRVKAGDIEPDRF